MEKLFGKVTHKQLYLEFDKVYIEIPGNKFSSMILLRFRLPQQNNKFQNKYPCLQTLY